MTSEPKKRMRDAEKSQQLLIKAVRSQLVEAGFAVLSTQTILSRAQVSKGVLFHHYPTKNHLIADAFEDLLVRFSRRLDETSDALRQSQIDKREFLQRVIVLIESDRFLGCMEIALDIRAEPVLGELTQDAVTQWRAEFFRFWVDTFDLPARSANTLRGQAFETIFGAPEDLHQANFDGFMKFYLEQAQVRPIGVKDTKIIGLTNGRKS